LDPGLTVGVAILDLSGDIISVDSYKEISRAELIKYITNHGKTVLMATDVQTPPKTVKKIATALNSKINSPYKDLAVGAKIESVEDYVKERSCRYESQAGKSCPLPQNAHERDALAAAIHGYKKYQQKLQIIERRIQSHDLSIKDVDNIKIMVINDIPITKAIDIVLETINASSKLLDDLKSSSKSNVIKKPETILNGSEIGIEISKSASEVVKEVENIREMVSKLKQKLKSQEKQNKNLQKRNSILEENVRQYKDEVFSKEKKIEKLHYQYSQNILHQKEIAKKTAIIKGIQEKYYAEKSLRKQLEENLQAIKGIRALEISKKAFPVKIIDNFTKDGIREAIDYWNIKQGDVVLLRNSEGGGSQTASLLIQIGVKAVIITDTMSHGAKKVFKTNMTPILEFDRVNLKITDEFAVINEEDLTREMERWKWDHENQQKKENKKKMLKLIDEYRAQRKRTADKS
jgi:predicted RNase H-like nuclease (RuvC/YqgF family)